MKFSILTLAGMASVAFVLTLIAGCRFGSDQIYQVYQVAADKEKIAFTYKSPLDKYFLVVYDTNTNNLKVFSQKSGVLSDPYLSGDGELFLVSSTAGPRHPDRTFTNLIECNSSYACKTITKTNFGISGIAKASNGTLLIETAQLIPKHAALTGNKYYGYSNFEFYALSPQSSTLKKISNINANGLNALSLSGRKLAFDYAAKPLYQPKAPRKRRQRETSSIFCGEFDADTAQLKLKLDAPCVRVGKKIDTQPFLSPDGANMAFLSASKSRTGGWLYEIVVVDMKTKNVIRRLEPSGDDPRAFSRPIFASNDLIRYVERIADAYRLLELDVRSGKSTELRKIHISELGMSTPLPVH